MVEKVVVRVAAYSREMVLVEVEAIPEEEVGSSPPSDAVQESPPLADEDVSMEDMHVDSSMSAGGHAAVGSMTAAPARAAAASSPQKLSERN